MIEVLPISRAGALDACRRWHYTKTITQGCTIRFGFGNDERFDGVIAFNPTNGLPPHVTDFWEQLAGGGRTCELSRIALRPQRERESPTTQYVSLALSKLREMRVFDLVYSYSDPRLHNGTLYRACSFYQYKSGKGGNLVWLTPDGKMMHGREIKGTSKIAPKSTAEALERGWRKLKIPNKERFFFPLTKRCRRRIERMIADGDDRILR